TSYPCAFRKNRLTLEAGKPATIECGAENDRIGLKCGKPAALARCRLSWNPWGSSDLSSRTLPQDIVDPQALPAFPGDEFPLSRRSRGRATRSGRKSPGRKGEICPQHCPPRRSATSFRGRFRKACAA